MFGSTAYSLRRFDLPPVTIDQLADLLRRYVRDTGTELDLLLIGGLALQAYGYAGRVTHDVDGEVVGDVQALATFLDHHHVPADIGEDISGWSVVAMPPGYRERASVWLDETQLRIRLLDPTDFVIAKLRRGMDLDLEDACFVVKQFQVTPQAVRDRAEAALRASPTDTALFLFRKTVDVFCRELGGRVS